MASPQGYRVDRRTFLQLGICASFAAASHRLLADGTFCAEPAPPITPKHPVKIEQLGRVRVDDYAWLKDPSWKQVWRDPITLNPEIKAYLQKENAYTDAVLAPTKKLQETLFEQMEALATEDETGPPLPDGDWLYYERFAPGAPHKSYFRKRRDRSGK
jgi:oligopeptidase B